jgi:Fic family protein
VTDKNDAALATSPTDGYQPIVDFKSWPALKVSESWDEFLAALNEQRGLATDESLRTALSIAVRSAALETGAIEGLYASTRGVTRTVAVQAAAWEAKLDELGADVRGHFTAQLAALEHVLETVDTNQPVTEVWLRELHALISGNQPTYRVLTAVGWQDQRLDHGEYKTKANHVVTAGGAIHYYCPVDDVGHEMHRLVENLASPEFRAAPAATQAAWAHHALTTIHPFADGNGRLARALASAYLYRSIRLPFVVFSDQKERYFDALAAADSGEVGDFARFVEDRTLDTMGLVASALRKAALPPGGIASELKKLALAHGGLTFAEVEALGQRLTELLKVAMLDSVSTSDVTDIGPGIVDRQGKSECNFGRPYHTLQSGGGFSVNLSVSDPVRAGVQVTPIVGVADGVEERFTYVVIDANRPSVAPLFLRMDDLYPSVTTSGLARLESWVAEAHERALAELRTGVAQQLKQQGFASRSAS